ncbi:l-ascorbate oxidase-like protein [Hordeum vulgare]|nr:l-ascorbate oxidase-like protein [Hordeum vulgare]
MATMVAADPAAPDAEEAADIQADTAEPEEDVPVEDEAPDNNPLAIVPYKPPQGTREATIGHQGGKGIPLGSCHNFKGAVAEGGTSTRGGTGVISSGLRGGRGQGRQSATPASPSFPGLGGQSDGRTLEFVVELHGVTRGHLHLPRPFARAMEAAKPPVLWLRAHSFSHGAMQVHVEYPKRRSMLLGRSWKAFVRAQSLKHGHILRFKLAEDNMLSVMFYGRSCVCLGYCEESSSGAECPSSSDSDKEDNSGSGALGRSRSRGVKSECDSPSSDWPPALPLRLTQASPPPGGDTLPKPASIPRL